MYEIFSVSSVVAVVGRPSFPSFVTGTDLWKNQIFAVFQKQAIFPKFKIFRQNECTRFFSLLSVVGHPSFPSFVTGTYLWKKIKFSPFFKNKQSFQNSRFLGKMSARDFFRCWRSSVIRHFPLSSQGRTCEKKSNFRRFSKTSNLSKIQDF